MGVQGFWSRLSGRLWHRHGDVRGFEQEVQAAGGASAGHDVGARIVPVEKIVGSVGRWQNLRSDFFYRKGAVTQRFVRIGEAMRRGIDLPPIEVYKLRRPPSETGEAPASEYYVVDGHHRVAMARKLGQDFLDAKVREFRVGGAPPGGVPGLSPMPGTPESLDAPTEGDQGGGQLERPDEARPA